MNRKKLTKTLGGNINGAWINIRGPGHGPNDCSLGIALDHRAPDGFWINSLAGDDPALCRNHVLKLLAKVASGDAIEIEMAETSANHAEQQKRIASALLIWQEAQP
jgi:hypothetical protein